MGMSKNCIIFRLPAEGPWRCLMQHARVNPFVAVLIVAVMTAAIVLAAGVADTTAQQETEHDGLAAATRRH